MDGNPNYLLRTTIKYYEDLKNQFSEHFWRTPEFLISERFEGNTFQG